MSPSPTRSSRARWLHNLCALIAIGSGGAVWASGCVDAEATFFVLKAVGPVGEFVTDNDGNISGEECDVCDFNSDILLSDFAFSPTDNSSQFSVCLAVRSGLVSTKDTTRPRAETNHVEIYAVDVEIEGIDNAPSGCKSFTVPAKGLVEPDQTGGVAVTVPISEECRTAFGAAVGTRAEKLAQATFVVHGHTTGGDEVETPAYSLPLRVSTSTRYACH